MRLTRLLGLACCAGALGACERDTQTTPEAPNQPASPETTAGAAAPTEPPAPKAKGNEAMTENAREKSAQAGNVPLIPKLDQYIRSLLPQVEQVPGNRRKELDRIAGFVSERLSANKPAKLTFICTHNSRRSHMGQLWAATAAAYYGLDGVEAFSGGTEATAFNPRAVAALERAGFAIENPGGENPHYKVRFSGDAPEQESFSKKYDDDFNPKEDFVAIMTCSQADKACPFVKGAAMRVAVPYVDPKESDGTPKEAATYDERAKQIATEMFYLFSQVKA